MWLYIYSSCSFTKHLFFFTSVAAAHSVARYYAVTRHSLARNLDGTRRHFLFKRESKTIVPGYCNPATGKKRKLFAIALVYCIWRQYSGDPYKCNWQITIVPFSSLCCCCFDIIEEKHVFFASHFST